jgi:alpha-N-arabinofuranosidase
MLLRALLVLLFCTIFQPRSVYSEIKTAVLTIDTNNINGVLPRQFIGNNIKSFLSDREARNYRNKGAGIWSPTERRPIQNFVAAAKTAGIKTFRWPGGKHSQYFDWQTAVGPQRNRRKQQFGLPEYLNFCEAVNADPIITLPVGSNKIASAASLVEYLNAPADGKNLNGGIDWAEIRKNDGRADPWGVIWFEYGNESYNIDTNIVTQNYIKSYRETRNAMQTVDTKVKLGAQLDGSEFFTNDWSKVIIQSLGNEMDFAVLHIYMPKLPASAENSIDKRIVAKAAMSIDADLSYLLHHLREEMHKNGAKDTPMIVSEFNGHYPGNDPVPYRFTLFNAVHNIEMLRVMMKPEYKIAMTNYWLFANEHWGMVRNHISGEKGFVKQADQLMFELFESYHSNHFVAYKIESEYFEFPGALGVSPRQIQTLHADTIQIPESGSRVSDKWKFRGYLNLDFSQTMTNDIVTVKFDNNEDVNYFHTYRTIAVEPDSRYRITTQIKTNGIQGGKVGIIVEDSRGWKNTYHQIKNINLSGTTADWVPASVEFQTLIDTNEIRVVGRRVGGSGIISGEVKFGTVKADKIAGGFGPADIVSAITTRSSEDNQVYAIIINKHLETLVKLEVELNANQSYQAVDATVLTGSSPFSTNFRTKGIQGVTLSDVIIDTAARNRFELKVPPASVVGIHFEADAQKTTNP